MESPVTLTITDLAAGPTAPRANATWPNALHTRVEDVVRKKGPAPWSQRLIADERNLVTLIASAPGGGNRPHWHREFDEWWMVLAGTLEWELTGGVVVRAHKDELVWVPRGTQTMSSLFARTTTPPVSSHSRRPASTTHHSSNSRCQCGRLPPPGGLAISVTSWRSSAMIRLDHGGAPIWPTTSATRVCGTLGQAALAAAGGVGPLARRSMAMEKPWL